MKDDGFLWPKSKLDEEEVEQVVETLLDQAQPGGLNSFDKLNYDMSRQLYERGWFSLWGGIDEGICENASLYLLNSLFRNKEKVTFFICSPGGNEDDARALIAIMEFCKSQGMTIRMLGAGLVASAAFDIFIAASKGYRFVSELTMFMTHSSSVETRDKSLVKLQDRLDEYTLQYYTKIHKKTRERYLETGNWYFSAQEGLTFGACDAVVKPGESLPEGPIFPKRKSVVDPKDAYIEVEKPSNVG